MNSATDDAELLASSIPPTLQHEPLLSSSYAGAHCVRSLVYDSNLAHMLHPLGPLRTRNYALASVGYHPSSSEVRSRGVLALHGYPLSHTPSSLPSGAAAAVAGEAPREQRRHPPRHAHTESELWVKSLRIARRLEGHSGCINSIAMDALGEVLLTGSDDRCVCLYDTCSWQRMQCYTTDHRANIFSAVFVPYTSRANILTCALDGQTLVLDTNTAQTTYKMVLAEMASSIVCSEAWPNTAYVAYDHGIIARIDTRCRASGEPSVGSPLPGAVRKVTALAAHSRYPYLLASGTDTSYVYLHDVRMGSLHSFAALAVKGRAPYCFRVADEGVGGLSFSERGDQLAVNFRSDDVYVVPWEREVQEAASQMSNYSYDPKVALTYSYKSTLTSEQHERCSEDHAQCATITQLPSTGGRSVPLVNCESSIQLCGRENVTTMFKEVAWMAEDSMVCSGGDDGKVHFWRVADGKHLHETQGDGDIVNGVLCHPKNHILITCGIDSTAKVLAPRVSTLLGSIPTVRSERMRAAVEEERAATAAAAAAAAVNRARSEGDSSADDVITMSYQPGSELMFSVRGERFTPMQGLRHILQLMAPSAGGGVSGTEGEEEEESSEWETMSSSLPSSLEEEDGNDHNTSDESDDVESDSSSSGSSSSNSASESSHQSDDGDDSDDIHSDNSTHNDNGDGSRWRNRHMTSAMQRSLVLHKRSLCSMALQQCDATSTVTAESTETALMQVRQSLIRFRRYSSRLESTVLGGNLEVALFARQERTEAAAWGRRDQNVEGSEDGSGEDEASGDDAEDAVVEGDETAAPRRRQRQRQQHATSEERENLRSRGPAFRWRLLDGDEEEQEESQEQEEEEGSEHRVAIDRIMNAANVEELLGLPGALSGLTERRDRHPDRIRLSADSLLVAWAAVLSTLDNLKQATEEVMDEWGRLFPPSMRLVASQTADPAVDAVPRYRKYSWHDWRECFLGSSYSAHTSSAAAAGGDDAELTAPSQLLRGAVEGDAAPGQWRPLLSSPDFSGCALRLKFLLNIVDLLLQGKESICLEEKDRVQYWEHRAWLELHYVYYFVALGEWESALQRCHYLDVWMEFANISILGAAAVRVGSYEAAQCSPSSSPSSQRTSSSPSERSSTEPGGAPARSRKRCRELPTTATDAFRTSPRASSSGEGEKATPTPMSAEAEQNTISPLFLQPFSLCNTAAFHAPSAYLPPRAWRRCPDLGAGHSARVSLWRRRLLVPLTLRVRILRLRLNVLEETLAATAVAAGNSSAAGGVANFNRSGNTGQSDTKTVLLLQDVTIIRARLAEATEELRERLVGHPNTTMAADVRESLASIGVEI